MAVLMQHKENAYQWGVWKTDESIDELLTLFPHQAKYESTLARFTSEHRRLEWLSVRILLYTLLGEEKEICYESNGKPYLADHSSFISISHTRGYVAVIVSKSPTGIDIEQYGERVHKVAHKYMREDEPTSHYEGVETWSLLLHWSAKEVMFKCMDMVEVDFKKHLRVYPFQAECSGEFHVQEFRTDAQKEFQFHYLLHPDFVFTWQVG